MNLFKLTIIILLGVVFSSHVNAQTIRSEQVKARLQELIELSKNRDYENAATYIVYRGQDESRIWNDIYNFNNVTERANVIQVCERIRSYFETYTSYEFDSFKTKKESEGLWYIWKVVFSNSKPDDKKSVYFAFLKINNNYVLGDID